MEKKTGRAYSTNYEDHAGLLRKLSLKGWGRLTKAGVVIDLDDVYQEMCVAYCKAAQKYDAERGITFTAYLGRAVWNEFNKIADRLIYERTEMGLTSLDAMTPANGEGDFDIYEVLDSGEWTPEQYVSAMQQFRENMQSLGPTAKFIIGKLLNPDDDLIEALEQKRAEAEAKRAEGKVASARRDISIALIADHYDLSSDGVKAARRSFSEILKAA